MIVLVHVPTAHPRAVGVAASEYSSGCQATGGMVIVPVGVSRVMLWSAVPVPSALSGSSMESLTRSVVSPFVVWRVIVGGAVSSSIVCCSLVALFPATSIT